MSTGMLSIVFLASVDLIIECKYMNDLYCAGAGVSAESGVPTFRGAGGLWRTWQAQDLASPVAFNRNPSLVWEFYHYRREVMQSKSPNPVSVKYLLLLCLHL